MTCIISLNPSSYFLSFSFSCRNWGLESLSALPSGSQLRNGRSKPGSPTPDSEFLIILFKNLDSPVSSGSDPKTYITNTLLPPMPKQMKQPWHLLLLTTFSCRCQVLEGFPQSRCGCRFSSSSTSSQELFFTNYSKNLPFTRHYSVSYMQVLFPHLAC